MNDYMSQTDAADKIGVSPFDTIHYVDTDRIWTRGDIASVGVAYVSPVSDLEAATEWEDTTILVELRGAWGGDQTGEQDIVSEATYRSLARDYAGEEWLVNVDASFTGSSLWVRLDRITEDSADMVCDLICHLREYGYVDDNDTCYEIEVEALEEAVDMWLSTDLENATEDEDASDAIASLSTGEIAYAVERFYSEAGCGIEYDGMDVVIRTDDMPKLAAYVARVARVNA